MYTSIYTVYIYTYSIYIHTDTIYIYTHICICSVDTVYLPDALAAAGGAMTGMGAVGVQVWVGWPQGTGKRRTRYSPMYGGHDWCVGDMTRVLKTWIV